MQTLAPVLDRLESLYGELQPGWPTDPYLFLIWWHCGYPPSEERCNRGWEALTAALGISPAELAATRPATLARALKPGGMVPNLRAARVKSIARSVQEGYAGDLRTALAAVPEAEARRLLGKFPGIGAPGTDRILLFGALAPVPAVPSSSPHVLVRLAFGREGKKYAATYARARQLIEAQVPATLGARTRAYLLLHRHAQRLCKRVKPQCGACPVSRDCAYFGSLSRAVKPRARRAPVRNKR